MVSGNSEEKRLGEFKHLLKDLLKVIKVVAMYPEGNPLPQSLRRTFAERMTLAVETYGEIAFRIEADKIYHGTEVAFTDGSKEESLAGLFFVNGISRLIFTQSLDVLEVYSLLDIIKAYQNQQAQGADLAAMLWESNLEHIRFSTVEDVRLAEYDGAIRVQEILHSETGSVEDPERYSSIFTNEDSDPPHGGVLLELPDDVTDDEIRELRELASAGDSSMTSDRSAPTRVDGRTLVNRMRHAKRTGAAFFLYDPSIDEPSREPSAMDSSTLKVAEAAEAMGFGDLTGSLMRAPDTALILKDEFKLSEEEENDIRGLLNEDAKFDMWESTVELLKEMLLQDGELQGFFETVSICEKTIQEFVALGRLGEASRVLEFMSALEGRVREAKPLWADRLRDARITAGNSSRMKVLAEALNAHPDIPVHDIRGFLDQFGWEALGATTDLLGELENRTHREVICDFLSNKGKENVAIIAKGIHDSRWYVVRNAVGILGKIHDDKALSYLLPALKHKDKRVRLEVLRATSDSSSPRTTEILVRAVGDPDRDIRQEALARLVKRGGKASFSAVAALVTGDTFGTLGYEERADILRVYAVLGREEAVPYLQRLVSRWNFFRDRELSELRSAALYALAHNPAPEAEAALLKFRDHWLPNLRNQARKAVELRRTVLADPKPRHVEERATIPEEVPHDR